MKNKYVCLNCGKEFLMTTRFQNGKDVGRKYCSNKCKRFMCGINYRYKFKTDIIKSYLNLLSVPEISEIENCPQWVIYNHFRRNKIKLRGTLSHSIIPELTITQQAYLAGIIDGEGCISLKMG
jgi:DNA-directed RNA polymerase subunit RPC12/RpoP